MSKNINVNRSVNDPFYRYKMPRIMAKVEGKGNGIKTVIANMSEIAKALSRPPTYPTKYFGCELGAQTNFDLKNDRYIVNGDHDAAKLQEILDGFIKKFVLCPACDNPETTLTVKPKSQTINSKCKACGHAFIIDPKQKLSTFILKNPPPTEGAEGETKEKGGSPAADSGDEGIPANESIVSGNGVNIEAMAAKEDDDDWAPEPVEESEKLSAQVGKLIIDKDLEKPVEERLDMLHQYFIRAKQEGTIQDGKRMLNEAERLEVKSKAALLLANVIFDTDVVNQIKANRALLLRFCLSDKKAQRHLLGGIEQLIANNKTTLLPKTAHIIKALYDTDVCEEDVILGWGEKPSSKFVKKDLAKEMIKIADPVLTWLKEADVDSEDGEEEDDDVAVNFDDRNTNGKPAASAILNGKKDEPVTVKDENDEDVDIDDI